ncbi:MAG: hypothetical protein NUV53_00425 [Patescibacteria group bacterium]|nr:hypothetical protein [Patescibacteria group bacterium]
MNKEEFRQERAEACLKEAENYRLYPGLACGQGERFAKDAEEKAQKWLDGKFDRYLPIPGTIGFREMGAIPTVCETDGLQRDMSPAEAREVLNDPIPNLKWNGGRTAVIIPERSSTRFGWTLNGKTIEGNGYESISTWNADNFTSEFHTYDVMDWVLRVLAKRIRSGKHTHESTSEHTAAFAIYALARDGEPLNPDTVRTRATITALA